MITIFDCLCHSIKYIQQTTVSLVNSLWFIGYFCNIKAIFHYLKLCIQHFLHSNAMLVKTLYIIQYCTHSLLSTSHKKHLGMRSLFESSYAKYDETVVICNLPITILLWLVLQYLFWQELQCCKAVWYYCYYNEWAWEKNANILNITAILSYLL